MLLNNSFYVLRNDFFASTLKSLRLHRLVRLGHDLRVLEMIQELLEPLDPSIFQLAEFVRIELRPFPILELFVEIENEQRMYKVDERKPLVCVILEIYRQVEKIVFPSMLLVDFFQNCVLLVFIRNVFYHNGCSYVLHQFDIL